MGVVAQRNFSAGELAPSLHAHTDLEKYQTGLRKCRNFVVQRHGGAANRTGTEFVAEVKDSTKTVRLVRFHFNDEQTYVMEFGHGYIRFFRDGARLTTSLVPAAWVTATAYVEGDIRLTGFAATLRYWRAKFAHTSAALTEPGVGANWATVWVELEAVVGGGIGPWIYEVYSPYPEADLMRLQMVQSGDVVTIAHPSYPPYGLSRLGVDSWTLRPIVFGPGISAVPGSVTVLNGSVGAALYWAVSAVHGLTYEESTLQTTAATVDRVPSAGTPTNVSWPAHASAGSYKVYRSTDGSTWGLIGSPVTNSFADTGVAPNYSSPPVRNPSLFDAVGEYPSEVMYYQQRLLFANSTNDPETIWGSRTAFFKNFSATALVLDDDAITFTMVGRQVNEVRHMLDLGGLVVFTNSEEKSVEGDEAGILRPDSINPRKISANGSDWLSPIEVNDSAVYLQDRGTIVRDLKPVSSSSYEGTDLTVFATHLFKGFTISDWDYAQNPDSVIWAVRSDGKCVALTYMTDQAIWGWHQHDTDGTFERVVSVPEGEEDSVYFVVKRTINGSVKRYIERLAVRQFTEVDDLIYSDSCRSYDGWNALATTMTISGGTTWAFDETLTLTASASTFVAGDVGNVFIVTLEDSAGVETARIRFTVDAYTSGTVVTGRPDKTVPASLRGVARATWARAIKTVTGLSHLNAKNVSVLGDGYVVASPNNSDYSVVTVAAGSAVLPEAYAVINVGLPYISDLETLDLDTPGRTSIKNKRLLVNKVGVYTESSRGIFAGQPDQPTTADPLKGLQQYRSRDDEDYAEPNELRSEYLEVATDGNWNNNGRVLIRQVDPLPVTVLAIMPIGYLPTDG